MESLKTAGKNPFPYSHTEARYHTFDHFARGLFGQKAARVSLDAGLTCPNRDGHGGVGGCLFCLGGSSSAAAGDIETQYLQGVEIARRKWGEVALLPYLQAGTNTYGDPADLRALYDRCARLPGARMLILGTRADCLSPEIVEVLAEVSRRIPLLVELGMQTVHDDTLQAIRRGYGHEEFVDGYRRLRAAGGDVRICLHLMNGLPGEDAERMLETAREVARLQPDMVKFHAVCVLRGTDLHGMWARGEYVPMTQEEYIAVLAAQLAVLPAEVVIGRICADAPRDVLAAPAWVRNKMGVRNALDRYLREREMWQGCGKPLGALPPREDAVFARKGK